MNIFLYKPQLGRLKLEALRKMLIILRGQRSVLYSSESSPADCSSPSYSVTNDIFRWHSLSCKHLWGWCSQENELRKAKNRWGAVTRHEDLPFLLWEGGISSLCRGITPWFAVGLGLCKGESWNLYLSMDCKVSPVSEATLGHLGGSFQCAYTPQSNSRRLQQWHCLFLSLLGWVISSASLCFEISQSRSGPGIRQHPHRWKRYGRKSQWHNGCSFSCVSLVWQTTWEWFFCELPLFLHISQSGFP